MHPDANLLAIVDRSEKLNVLASSVWKWKAKTPMVRSASGMCLARDQVQYVIVFLLLNDVRESSTVQYVVIPPTNSIKEKWQHLISGAPGPPEWWQGS